MIIITLLIVATFIFGGCSSKKDIGGSVVGTWQDTNGKTMQFFEDGTVTSKGLISATGKYSFPDSNHIKVEFQGIKGISGPQVYEYSFKDGNLELKDSDGGITVYTPVN